MVCSRAANFGSALVPPRTPMSQLQTAREAFAPPVAGRGGALVISVSSPDVVEGERCIRQLSREVECMRAACASASPLWRWWLRRRLRALEIEKVRLEQREWRRRR